MIFHIKNPREQYTLLAVVGAILSSILIQGEVQVQAVTEKPNQAVVFVNLVKAAELFDFLTYPARVVAKINSTVLSETDGVITKILAPLGQWVSRGQRLLTITHTDPVYQYAPMEVTAPAAGVVSLVEVTEGSQVIKGQRLLAVTNPSQVKITIEVPAQDMNALSRGTLGEFRIEGRDDPVPVKVRGMSAWVDPATGTATCELELEKQKKPLTNLLPGVVGQVTFKTRVRKGISIPDHAVFFKGNETFVRLLDNGKAKQVAVRLGHKQRGYVEVLNGLSDGAPLIERTSRFVGEGEAVVVQRP